MPLTFGGGAILIRFYFSLSKLPSRSLTSKPTKQAREKWDILVFASRPDGVECQK
jgi:hypothetical protein